MVNVEQKGYLHRVKRGRKKGDLFLDPLTRRPGLSGTWETAAPTMRDALIDVGIRSNPYDRRDLELEGKAADRAREIIRRNLLVD